LPVSAQVSQPAELSAQQELSDAHEILAEVLASAGTGQVSDVPLEQVFGAATAVFQAVHEALAAKGEGTVLPRDARRHAWERLEQARRAVEEVASRAWAKHLQRRATGGHPLTICFGRRVRRVPELAQFGRPDSSWAEDIVYKSWGDGCGAIFTDSADVFARYCTRCRSRPGGYFGDKVIRERVAADEGRIRVHRYDQEGNRVLAWRVTCTACGERFETLEPRVRRCDPCRRGHRAAPT
jgi:hypothetical protein